MIEVIVADDHKLVRQMLASAIENEDDMTFLGGAVNGSEAIAMASGRQSCVPTTGFVGVACGRREGVRRCEKV